MLGLLSTVDYDTFGALLNIYISRNVYVAIINKLYVTLDNNGALWHRNLIYHALRTHNTGL